MIKRILTIALAATMMLSIPASSMASNLIEIVEFVDIDVAVIQISVNGNVLHVTGAAGQKISVYNVAGVCVYNANVDSADKHFDLNLSKGCYIIKVGKVVRKISIK